MGGDTTLAERNAVQLARAIDSIARAGARQFRIVDENFAWPFPMFGASACYRRAEISVSGYRHQLTAARALEQLLSGKARCRYCSGPVLLSRGRLRDWLDRPLRDLFDRDLLGSVPWSCLWVRRDGRWEPGCRN